MNSDSIMLNLIFLRDIQVAMSSDQKVECYDGHFLYPVNT